MDDGLRAELLRRVEKDQVARKALDADAMREADGENLPWLKEVVAAHGWPGASLVGTDGAHAAWLLAQHADADPAFQRQCLGLIGAAVEAGEASLLEYAYLTDRVLLAEGRSQVYGTQVTRRDGAWVPRGPARPGAGRRAPGGRGPRTARGVPGAVRRLPAAGVAAALPGLRRVGAVRDAGGRRAGHGDLPRVRRETTISRAIKR